jgi:hypothetical protein
LADAAERVGEVAPGHHQQLVDVGRPGLSGMATRVDGPAGICSFGLERGDHLRVWSWSESKRPTYRNSRQRVALERLSALNGNRERD